MVKYNTTSMLLLHMQDLNSLTRYKYFYINTHRLKEGDLTATYRINAWFNSTCYHPTPGHTPGDLQFFSHLAVYSPPPGKQQETIPHPRDSSSTTNTLFCVQNRDDDIDFCTTAKPDIFDENLNAFLQFIEQRILQV